MLVPFPHQIDAQEALLRMEQLGSGGFLCDQPGLGKTYEMAMFMKQNKFVGKADLIVCPFSVMSTWKDTIIVAKDWPTEGEKPTILVYHGKDRVQTLYTKKYDYVITTYSILGTGELNDMQWGRIVLDESHCIKNGLLKSAPRCAKAAFRVGLHSEKNWCLTATPFNNRMKDVASQCMFVGTSPYNDPTWWKNNENNTYQTGLWRKNFVLRRTKDGLLAKPIYHNIKVTPTPRETTLVNDLRAKAAEKFEEWKYATGSQKVSLQAKLLGLIQRLRIVSNSFYSGETTIDGYEVIEHNAKVDAMINNLDDQVIKDPKRGVVIFSQFTSFLSVLEQVIEQAVVGIKVLKFTGDMNERQRDDVVKEFNTSRDPRVILVSLLAGGCGLSLHHGSSTVFISEPYYNGFIEQQAEERVHRMGQKAQVNVYRYSMENSVETWIEALKERKAGLASILDLDIPYNSKPESMFTFNDLSALFMDHVSFKPHTNVVKHLVKEVIPVKKESAHSLYVASRNSSKAPRPKRGRNNFR